MISEMMIKVPTHQSIAGFYDFPFALASDGLVCLSAYRRINNMSNCWRRSADRPISPQMTQRACSCSGTPTVELPLLIAARV